MNSPRQIIVSGGFDDIKSRDLRFLEEAAKLGELTVLLWPDATLQRLTGKSPKFPLTERMYFLDAVRYVNRVIEADSSVNPDVLPTRLKADIWADYGMMGGGKLGLFALFGTFFFMSVMFPTIFALDIRGLGDYTKLGSSSCPLWVERLRRRSWATSPMSTRCALAWWCRWSASCS